MGGLNGLLPGEIWVTGFFLLLFENDEGDSTRDSFDRY